MHRTLTLKKVRIKDKLEQLKSEMAKLDATEKQVLASPDQQVSVAARPTAQFVPSTDRLAVELGIRQIAIRAGDSRRQVQPPRGEPSRSRRLRGLSPHLKSSTRWKVRPSQRAAAGCRRRRQRLERLRVKGSEILSVEVVYDGL